MILQQEESNNEGELKILSDEKKSLEEKIDNLKKITEELEDTIQMLQTSKNGFTRRP